MKYRKEIDGLRALAIMPVILFHAGFHSFSGGFVGVDVFFVISGYLITSKIIEDLEAGQFRLKVFYERRARRILPALFFVMLVCIPVAWVTLIPSDFQQFSTNSIGVALFVSNIVFWFQDGYFAPNSEQNPLLHTWSLAVEEQFYLFFPLFVIALFALGRRWVIGGIVTAAMVSLLFAQLGANLSYVPPFFDSDFKWFNQPALATFYLPTGRIWELMFGALAAFYLQKKRPSTSPYSEPLAVLGLVMILISIFIYDASTVFPSVYTIVPTLGTVLIILFASSETGLGRYLSFRIFVGIGLVSYSAYLWHQPLFAFARLRTVGEIEPWMLGILGIIAFALAYLSWRYIEAPFRNRHTFSQRQIFLYSGLTILVIVAFGVVGVATKGFEHRFQSEHLEYKKLRTFGDSQCRSTKSTFEEFCQLGLPVDPKFAILGDSHAAALFDSVVPKIEEQGMSFLGFSADWCAPLYGFELSHTKCMEKMRVRLQQIIADDRIEFVILVAEWSLYSSGYRWSLEPLLAEHDLGRADTIDDNAAVFEQALSETVELLRLGGKEVVLIDPIPELEFDLVHTLDRKEFLGLSEQIRPPSLQSYQTRNSEVLKIFSNLGGRVERVRTEPLFCSQKSGVCDVFDDNGMPLYSDSNHLNELGAARVATVLVDHISDRLSSASKKKVDRVGAP